MRLSRFSDVLLRHVGIFGWEYRFVFVATVLSCRFYNTFYLSYFSIYPTVKMFSWKITIVKGQVKISIRHVNREKLLWAFCCYGTVEYRSFWLAVFFYDVVYGMQIYCECRPFCTHNHLVSQCLFKEHVLLETIQLCVSWVDVGRQPFVRKNLDILVGKQMELLIPTGSFAGKKSAICRKMEQYHFPGHHAQTFKQNNAFACVLHFCTFLCRPFQTIKWRGKFKVS